jgi:formylglycine-generating enzyme
MSRGGLRLGGAILLACGLGVAAAWSLQPLPLTAPLALGDRSHCAAYGGLPVGWAQDPHAGMTRIPAGDFGLGSLRGYAEERPVRQSHIAAFWIDRTEVTNAQFASFVAATGYVTEAEQHPGAAVFRVDPQQPVTPGSWWHLVDGADWRHPEGPGSSIAGRDHEPVVDVTYADALAYAHWLHRELPSEAQWEYAAKAGRDDQTSDHSLYDAKGRPQANFWQGAFPLTDRAEDGFAGRAPVGCYPANPYGLQDMVGNVWEWTTDLYVNRHLPAGQPEGLADIEDAMPVRSGAPRRVIKGGSYLCSLDYCARARASSRQAEESDLPAVHLGFRTIADE